MSWFRFSSIVFALWGMLFGLFPRFSNEIAALDRVTGGHADDWTRIVGLFSFAFSYLLHQAHRSSSPEARRVVARGVLVLTVPCALLMAYWQIVPDRLWVRLDLGNVALLAVISYGMVSEALGRRSTVGRGSSGD